MIQRLTHLITVVGIALLTLAPLALVSTPALADAKSSVCKGVNIAGGTTGTGCEPGNTSNTVNRLVANIINIFSWVVGVTAVIFVIFGGFRFITAGGDAAKIAGARNTIMYALIGLVIVATAQLIVKFVLGNVAK